MYRSFGSIPKESDVIRRRMTQAGSSFFLGAAMLTFPPNIDQIYWYGCLGTLLTSLVFHYVQEPHVPPIKKRKLTRLPSSQYEWPCSKHDDSHILTWFLIRLDRAFVTFICLYTGCHLHHYNNYPFVIIGASLLAGIIGLPLQSFVIGYALYLSVTGDHKLSDQSLGIFLAAAIIGPVCFVYMDLIGAWCTPYRYIWHACCACLISIAGVLNADDR